MALRDPSTPFGGDAPCTDCGTNDNIVWFTESVFWNAVCRSDPDYIEPILCIPCFVRRAQLKGYRPTGWRLLAEWHWTNVRDPESDAEEARP